VGRSSSSSQGEKMRSVLAVFDVDGVLVKEETQKLLACYLFYRGKLGIGLFLKIVAWFVLYKLHLIKDSFPMRRQAYRIFRGWREDDMHKIMRDFFREVIAPRISGDAIRLLRGHQERREDVLLLSASLSCVVELFAQYLKVPEYIATHLKITEGCYTGDILGDVPYGENKVKAFKQWLEKTSGYDQVVVYADHISDLSLFELADERKVVNPDGRLRDLAHQRGWSINDFS
jgi:HAD superfamily hydrolase (TIGR01490 family)